jgi:hypothetical protein
MKRKNTSGRACPTANPANNVGKRERKTGCDKPIKMQYGYSRTKN